MLTVNYGSVDAQTIHIEPEVWERLKNYVERIKQEHPTTRFK